MYKAFKYRIYPTRQQQHALETLLETHRGLYNDALAERTTVYEAEHRSVTYGQQSAALKTTRRTNPFLAATNFSSCQATLRRLDEAFQAFFRRVKAGETPGYPRLKGRNRFDTVEFPSYGDGCKLNHARLYLQHVGYIKVKLHRPLDGHIKTVSVKREASAWSVVLVCDIGTPCVQPSSRPATGFDLGLKSFLVTADGMMVEPPKYFRTAAAKLRRLQRKVARRKDGSQRQRKVRATVRNLHRHIANQRRDFHHKTARRLVQTYGTLFMKSSRSQGLPVLVWQNPHWMLGGDVFWRCWPTKRKKLVCR